MAKGQRFKGLVHEKSSRVKLTVRARNLNFLDISGPTFFLIFLLYEYVEGHMTLDDFSWTDLLWCKGVCVYREYGFEYIGFLREMSCI